MYPPRGYPRAQLASDTDEKDLSAVSKSGNKARRKLQDEHRSLRSIETDFAGS